MMSKVTMRVGAMLIVLGPLLFAGSEVSAQQPEMPTPGPEHEKLKMLVGAWDATMDLYMVPGQPPVKSKGKEICESGLGGFWIVTRFESDFAGQPFIGHGYYGYDPYKKKYIALWADSGAPTPAVSEGSFDESGKVLTLKYKGRGMTGELTDYILTYEFKNKDLRIFSIESKKPDGKMTKDMQIEYRRKK